MQSFDTVIIGGGVIGMAIARELKRRQPNRSVALFEKESAVAQHTSSRNSGVLHAGFYYTSDSLKAKLTVAGNRAWREFCQKNSIPINECGKLVVARNDSEVEQLFELERRGKQNGSTLALVTAEQARAIDPNVVTHRHALWSPKTASVDPSICCQALAREIQALGVTVFTQAGYLRHTTRSGGQQRFITTNQSLGEIETRLFINAAGLYADKIAHALGFGLNYAIVPFKGKYIEFTGDPNTFKVHVYPVPDLRNPFLGVHFTKKSNGSLKIGPTATPAFWREHYTGLSGFRLGELLGILWLQLRMFLKNTNNFRNLAWEEIKKMDRKRYIQSACVYARAIDGSAFGDYAKPGIRAQLVDRHTLKLVQDFKIESGPGNIHVLNAISPGFTCAFPFAEYVLENYDQPV